MTTLYNYIQHKAHAIKGKAIATALALVAVAGLNACSDDLADQGAASGAVSVEALSVCPQIFRGTEVQQQLAKAISRAVGDKENGNVELNENYLGQNIDVFVVKAGQTSIFKQYHYTRTVTDKALHQLKENWRAEQLEEGQKYDVYVAVNNELTHNDVSTLEELMELQTTDEHVHMIHRADYNGSNYTGGEDMKQDNAFMMDGMIKDWDPADTKTVANSQGRKFAVELNRAAAKMVMDIDFTDEFKAELDGMGLESAAPVWKHVNFADQTRVFAQAEPLQLAEDDLKTGAVYNPATFTTGQHAYQLLTYAFAIDWQETENAMDMAPYLLLKVPFVKKGESTALEPTYSYYRLAVVDESASTSIERNHVYHVSAHINGFGSSSEDDFNKVGVNLKYEVLPWTDEEMTVIGEKAEYLMVDPTELNLYEAHATASLKYFAPADEEIEIVSTGSDDDGNVFGAYWYNYMHQRQNLTWNDSETMVTIDKENKTINISTDVLNNHTVKYIYLRVRLKNNPSMYEDVIIRHFPVDNIQNIQGHWSSRAEREEKTLISETPKDGYTMEVVDVSEEQYNAWGGEKNRTEGTERVPGDPVSISQQEFKTNVNTETLRRNANGIANAYSKNGYYYYGDEVHQIYTSTANADYSRGGNNNKRYYKYSNYYKYQYVDITVYHYTITRYFKIDSESSYNFENSVMWDRDSQTASPTAKTTSFDGGDFRAKVFYNDKIYYITHQGNQTAKRGSEMGKNNPHMYVIQITNTSDDYVIGRPQLDHNYQSKDQVTSPAFMLASQLGATLEYDNGLTAAAHCGQYLEVGTDGTYYTGWRLPTRQEIGVIIKYQRDENTSPDVISEVLTGSNYWTLEGKAVSSNASNWNNIGSDKSTGNIRCVRDLTADELAKLNKKK